MRSSTRATATSTRRSRSIRLSQASSSKVSVSCEVPTMKVKQMVVCINPDLLRELLGNKDVVLMGARAEFGRLFLDIRGAGGPEQKEDCSLPAVKVLDCFESLKNFRADEIE